MGAEGRDEPVSEPSKPTLHEPTLLLQSSEDTDHKTEKLALEVKLLRRQLTFSWTLLEILKSVAGTIAILAFLWTVFNGLKQLEHSTKEEVSARFERAFTKIGSTNSQERATGVSQLSELLMTNCSSPPSRWGLSRVANLAGGPTESTDNGARQREVMSALINQLALEKDAVIRGAILGAISRIDPKRLCWGVLNDALNTTVAHNRSVIDGSDLSRLHLSLSIKSQRHRFLVPSPTAHKWTDTIYDIYQLASDSEQHSLEILGSLSAVITELLAKGARTSDLSGIYCPRCDFASTKSDLTAVDFSHALLEGANFRGVPLSKANFTEAFIPGTDFREADLRSANFTAKSDRSDFMADFVAGTGFQIKGFKDEQYVEPQRDLAPFFDCADMRDATLSGAAFFLVEKPTAANGIGKAKWQGFGPTFGDANLAHANLVDLRVITVFRVSTTTRDYVKELGRTFPLEGNLDFFGPEDAPHKLVVGKPDIAKKKYAVFVREPRWSAGTSDPDLTVVSDFVGAAKAWESANLPDGVARYITAKKGSIRSLSHTCKPH